MNMHDLVPYLQDNQVHNWGHVVESFRFESDEEGYKISQKVEMMEKLGWRRMPLDHYYAHVSSSLILLELSRLTRRALVGAKPSIHVPVLLEGGLNAIQVPEQTFRKQ